MTKKNGHGQKGHNSSYRFMVGDKDEIIDLIRGEASRQGDEQLRMGYLNRLAADAAVHPSTLYGWFHGDTRFPRSITVRLVLQALDCKMKIVRSDGTEVRRRHG
jgi:hypothetical protein